MESETIWFLPMHFPTRLIQLRKAADLTQQTLADTASVHVNQIRRYEAGTAQPTLEALIRLAQALRVSLDDLVFAEGNAGHPTICACVSRPSVICPAEKAVIKALLDGMILKYQASRIMGTSSNNQASS